MQRNSMMTKQDHALSERDLRQIAPSIFTVEKREGLSDRYQFIPTYELVQEMIAQGWQPMKVQEQRVNSNNLNRQGYQKHLIRFRNLDVNGLQVNDTFIDMLLQNSHDGLSSFIFNKGLFRKTCMNGMVVEDQNLEHMKIKHNSYQASQVVDIIGRVVNDAPRLIDSIHNMQDINLTPDDRNVFALAAKSLRFDENADIRPEHIARPRRTQDQRSDLWTTYNVVQENLIRGGIPVYTTDDHNRRQIRHSREVNGIDADMKINKGLWILSEYFAQQKREQAI